MELTWSDTLNYGGNFPKKGLLNEVGSHNPIFKGMMPSQENGRPTPIAIKLLNHPSHKHHFIVEKTVLKQATHDGIVKLLGYCEEGRNQTLVYEYMPLKDLRKNIPSLDWQRSLRILRNVAQAIVYLHDELNPAVIHRDLNASNILMDKEWNPKLSSFKGSKWGQYGCPQPTGTKGSSDPSARLELPDTRHDVYSYGILILEVLTKKSNLVMRNELIKWVELKRDKVEQIVHEKLRSTGCTSADGTKAIALANQCTDPGVRPNMAAVLRVLNEELHLDD